MKTKLKGKELSEAQNRSENGITGRKSWTALALGAGVFLTSSLWFAFWIYGQPFFNDDYHRWIPDALSRSYGDIFLQILSPFPKDWGFLNRPVITLFFKLTHHAFGIEPLPYFLVKSFVAAGLSTLLFVFSVFTNESDASNGRKSLFTCLIPSLLFITASPTFMAMLWLGDMEVLAQLFLMSVLLLYLVYRRHGLHNRPVDYKTVLFQLLVFSIALLGFRTKLSALVAPVIILVHSTWEDRRFPLHFLPLAAAMILVNIPWTELHREPLPDVLSFSSNEDAPLYYWTSINLVSFSNLFLGDLKSLWPFSQTTINPYGLVQVLMPFGIVAFALSSLALGRKYRSASPPVEADTSQGKRAFFDSAAKLLIVWFVTCAMVLAIYPILPKWLMSRYLIAILVPVFLGLGRLTEHAMRTERLSNWLKRALMLCLVLQIAAGVYEISLCKRLYGYNLVMVDKIRSFVEENYIESNIVYDNLLDHGYVPNNRGNRILSLVKNYDLTKYQRFVAERRPVYLVSEKLQKHPWIFEASITMDTGFYYDLIGPGLSPNSTVPRHVYRLKKR